MQLGAPELLFRDLGPDDDVHSSWSFEAAAEQRLEAEALELVAVLERESARGVHLTRDPMNLRSMTTLLLRLQSFNEKRAPTCCNDAVFECHREHSLLHRVRMGLTFLKISAWHMSRCGLLCLLGSPFRDFSDYSHRLFKMIDEPWTPVFMMDESAAWITGLEDLRDNYDMAVHSIFCAWHWWDLAMERIAKAALVREHRDLLTAKLKDIERIHGGRDCSEDVAVAEGKEKLEQLRDVLPGVRPAVRCCSAGWIFCSFSIATQVSTPEKVLGSKPFSLKKCRKPKTFYTFSFS
jgi:hypothetical protein